MPFSISCNEMRARHAAAMCMLTCPQQAHSVWLGCTALDGLNRAGARSSRPALLCPVLALRLGCGTLAAIPSRCSPGCWPVSCLRRGCFAASPTPEPGSTPRTAATPSVATR